MGKLKILDLCCKAGGASVGLHLAGFDVTGVDKELQKNYPFKFIQGDALTVDLSGYDAFWASPPCEKYSKASATARIKGFQFDDLVEPIRERLIATGKPYIIENVVGAPLHFPITLCGTMFGLKVFRHRLFESNYLLFAPPHLPHTEVIGENGFVCVVGGNSNSNKKAAGKLADWKPAMGIDWMNRTEMTKAIPPAYSKFLGEQLMNFLKNKNGFSNSKIASCDFNSTGN